MPSVTITESPQTPQLVRDAYFEAARQQMELAMIDVEGQVKELMPARTGTGRRSVTHMVQVTGNQIMGAVGSALRYVAWINSGTGLYGEHHHPIVPKHAVSGKRPAALRFPTPGNRAFTQAGRQRSGKAGQGATWVIVRSVKGVKPMHFFERAFDMSREIWTRKLEQVPAVAQKLIEQRTRGRTA